MAQNTSKGRAHFFPLQKETWEQIKIPYRSTFRDLVTGELPEESMLIDSLAKVSERLQTIKWELKVNNLKCFNLKRSYFLCLERSIIMFIVIQNLQATLET